MRKRLESLGVYCERRAKEVRAGLELTRTESSEDDLIYALFFARESAVIKVFEDIAKWARENEEIDIITRMRSGELKKGESEKNGN